MLLRVKGHGLVLCILTASALLGSVSQAEDKSWQRLKVYVWTFDAATELMNPLAGLLTTEFEYALAAENCLDILERRDYDRLLAHKENEKAISRIASLPPQILDDLKSEKADAIIFGEIIDDLEGGEIRVSVTLEKLTGIKLKIESVRLSRGKRFDPESRESAMTQIAHSMCSKEKPRRSITSAPEGQSVEVVDSNGAATVLKEAGFYLGPISGTAKGVPVAIGSRRKLISWSEIWKVEFLSGDQVRVYRNDGRVTEGALHIHALRRDLVGRDVDGDTVRIPVNRIRLVNTHNPLSTDGKLRAQQHARLAGEPYSETGAAGLQSSRAGQAPAQPRNERRLFHTNLTLLRNEIAREDQIFSFELRPPRAQDEDMYLLLQTSVAPSGGQAKGDVVTGFIELDGRRIETFRNESYIAVRNMKLADGVHTLRLHISEPVSPWVEVFRLRITRSGAPVLTELKALTPATLDPIPVSLKGTSGVAYDPERCGAIAGNWHNVSDSKRLSRNMNEILVSAEKQPVRMDLSCGETSVAGTIAFQGKVKKVVKGHVAGDDVYIFYGDWNSYDKYSEFSGKVLSDGRLRLKSLIPSLGGRDTTLVYLFVRDKPH